MEVILDEDSVPKSGGEVSCQRSLGNFRIVSFMRRINLVSSPRDDFLINRPTNAWIYRQLRREFPRPLSGFNERNPSKKSENIFVPRVSPTLAGHTFIMTLKFLGNWKFLIGTNWFSLFPPGFGAAKSKSGKRSPTCVSMPFRCWGRQRLIFR